MSELLSREKEFLKLNEELNVKTKILLEKPLPSKENRSAVSLTSRQSSESTVAEAPPNNRLGKPPIKPRSVTNKANTVPRNSRQPSLIPFTPFVRSTPKVGKGDGSATFRVVKENSRCNNNENDATLAEKGNENSIESGVNILPEESSMNASCKDSSRSSITTSCKRSVSQNSFASTTSNASLPKKNLSSEGLVKFLKSKVSILENELESSSQELVKKSKELERALELQKKMETQRDQAYSKNNSLTGHVSKLEARLTELEQRLKEREAEFIVTGREMESLKRELRLLTQTNANLEKRLYRANEELENVKNTLTSVREADRELQETVRKEKDDHIRQLKTLKKQRSELLSAYKKQLFLMDNLKRQTVCLEQARLISFAEKEFTKVLEWNSKN
ncbi:testis-expressed protein 9 [Hermetia illucens]|uniref:testis-expressed protein 9 n=1 Tax=Hermetia illucens TaxID=343691 RepID=UPI0018CC5B5F|nr:testis-expressed protein 9 [Hermetia illucens]